MANTGTWKKITYVKQYCNTPSRKAGYLQPRSYMATQYSTHFLLTNVHWIQNDKARLGKQSSQHKPHNLPDISIKSHVAVQHPMTKLWDT